MSSSIRGETMEARRGTVLTTEEMSRPRPQDDGESGNRGWKYRTSKLFDDAGSEGARAAFLTQGIPAEQSFEQQLEDRADATNAETAALENSDDPQDRAEASERRAAR